MGYLFKDVSLVSMDEARPELFRGDLLVEGRKITKIGTDIPKSAHKVIEGRNLLVMPGFVNTHTHVSMTLMRSYGDDLELFDWLNNRIWPVEARLTKNDVYLGANLGIAEMLLSGTTCMLDMYQDMEMVGRSILESGIRGHISRGTICTGDKLKDGAALEQLEALIEGFHNLDEGRIKVLAGPHAIYTNSEDFLLRQMAIAEKNGIGVNIHVSETLKENSDVLSSTGLTPVAYLEKIGLLDSPYTVAAHMVHLNDEDIRIAVRKGVGVAHNPKSNLKLGSGIANVDRYLSQGLKVGLGTDGAASNNALDMVSELQFASLLQKGINHSPASLTAYETLRMATLGGAQVLNIDDQVGRLKEGYEADLIMFDMNQPHFYPLENSPIANIAYSSKSSDIVLTMVAGKILMQDRKLTTISLPDTYKELGEIVGRIYS